MVVKIKTLAFLSLPLLLSSTSCLKYLKPTYEPIYERKVSKPLNDAYSNEPVYISKLKDDEIKTIEGNHSTLVECWVKSNGPCAFYFAQKFSINKHAAFLFEQYKKIQRNSLKNIAFIKSPDIIEQGFYIIYESPEKQHIFYGKGDAFYYAATFNAPVQINNNFEYNTCKYEKCISKIIKTKWFKRQFHDSNNFYGFDVLFFLREDYANLIVVDERYKTINRIIYSLGGLKLFPFESLELRYKKRTITFGDGKTLELKMIDVENARVIISLDLIRNAEQNIEQSITQVVVDVLSNDQLLSFIYDPRESFYIISTNWK